jgi:ATP-dependent Lhr-like helicase
MIHDAGGYLAVLPDGTAGGTLDPRFVGNEPGKIFSFMGKNWQLLSPDDMHKCALIEPASVSRNEMKLPFWNGHGIGGVKTSPTICGAVCQLLARGKTLLPLPRGQQKMLDDLIWNPPEDFVPGTVHTCVESEIIGWSVIVATFLGIRANMALARLLKNRFPCGKCSMRYDQFAIRIFGCKSPGAAERIDDLLRTLSEMETSVLAGEIPELPVMTGKVDVMLPQEMLPVMEADEYYRLDFVLAGISSVRVRQSVC